MYSSQLETDPQFVFTPSQLRHELTFDLTMMTLGSYGYDADLSSYSDVQLQCSFSNDGAHNTTIILQQGPEVTCIIPRALIIHVLCIMCCVYYTCF